MQTIDHLTDIIVRSERLDVEFKSVRRMIGFYNLTENEIAVVEGKA